MIKQSPEAKAFSKHYTKCPYCLDLSRTAKDIFERGCVAPDEFFCKDGAELYKQYEAVKYPRLVAFENGVQV